MEEGGRGPRLSSRPSRQAKMRILGFWSLQGGGRGGARAVREVREKREERGWVRRWRQGDD